MRKLIVMLTLIGSLSFAACGGQSDKPLDKADHDDPVAYQKAYCKESGWDYEAATNTCKQ